MAQIRTSVVGYVVKSAKGELLALEYTSKGYVFGVTAVFFTVYTTKQYAENDVANFNRRGYECSVVPLFGTCS